MNYRTAELLAETNYVAATTTTIPINVEDIVSRLIISWRISHVGRGMDSYPHSDISKIELVDGSEVLHSLSGGENQAVCIYDRKVQTMNHGQHVHACDEYSSYGIDFGRYLYDPLYAFDPSKFNNPQLKISHSHLICDTGATSGNLQVWAQMFDEKIVSPAGMLVSRQIKDYTVAQAGVYDYVELPHDRVLRSLFIQGYKSAFEPWSVVIEARLNEDGFKRIPFDWELEDYHRLRKGWDQPIVEQMFVRTDSTGCDIYVTPTDYYTTPLFANWNVDTHLYHNANCKGGKVAITSEGAETNAHGIVMGWLPNHMFQFPFGRPQDPEDWYDVTKLGHLDLRVKTGAGAAGNIRTSVQQVRMY